MDIHPDAAAMSAISPSAACESATSCGGSAPAPGVERRVDDGLHLRARLLKMILTQEQARKSSADSPR